MTNHPRRNLSTKQREVLEMVTERHAEGVCINGSWVWLIDGVSYTRQINALKKKGLVDGIYFSGGRASLSATEQGHAACWRRSKNCTQAARSAQGFLYTNYRQTGD